MQMRKKFLNIGEKVFNALVFIAFLAGIITGVFSGIAVGGVHGLAVALIQILLSWSGTLIISLMVYALLDIRCSIEK